MQQLIWNNQKHLVSYNFNIVQYLVCRVLKDSHFTYKIETWLKAVPNQIFGITKNYSELKYSEDDICSLLNI